MKVVTERFLNDILHGSNVPDVVDYLLDIQNTYPDHTGKFVYNNTEYQIVLEENQFIYKKLFDKKEQLEKELTEIKEKMDNLGKQ